MKLLFFALGILTTPLATRPVQAASVTTLDELRQAIVSGASCTNDFCVEGTVVYSAEHMTSNATRIIRFALADESDGVPLEKIAAPSETLYELGSYLRAEGRLVTKDSGRPVAKASHVTRLTPPKRPPPPLVTGNDFIRGKFINRVVAIEGTVVDSVRDEIDPQYSFIVLDANSTLIYVAIFNRGTLSTNCINGAFVRISGRCLSNIGDNARTGMHIELHPAGIGSIELLREPPENPFAVPDINTLQLDVNLIQAQALRCMKVRGQVVACWEGNRLLIRQANCGVSKVRLATADSPRYGQLVEAVGYPETDLFSINLSRAIWREIPGTKSDDPAAEPVTATHLLTDGHGNQMIKAKYNGRHIRLTGEVRGIYKVERNCIKVDLACEGHQIGAYLSYTDVIPDNLEVGSVIEATGTCVMETETWRPQTPFPRIEDVALAIHSPADIRVLAHPPWWKPARMAVAGGGLLAALIGILIWNLALRRSSERKGRQLFRAQIEKVKANLKTDERTRLAVELHDSIAQNLTGVAMEIETAKRLAPPAASAMMEHLDLGSRTLQSCRDELRNCLWDLRCQALEAKDMNAAIRSTLQPHADKAQINVRFNVLRSLLPDNTAHAILCVIRELVINAIRHGQASAVQIAGELDDKTLMFSVRDNGTGFDPAAAPSVLQGHFGLQGIEERVRQLGGTFTLSSEVGKGTRGKVVIPRTRIVGSDRQEQSR